MTRHYYLVPLLLAVALVGCRSTGGPAPRAAQLDQAVLLAPGERVVFGPQQLDVEFVRVSEDSRCPRDLTCVWAGEAKVQLSIRNSASEVAQHEVIAGQRATIGELRVVVVQVQPEPVSGRAISPEDYRVTLQVGINDGDQ